jgi:hypothetical protein
MLWQRNKLVDKCNSTVILQASIAIGVWHEGGGGGGNSGSVRCDLSRVTSYFSLLTALSYRENRCNSTSISVPKWNPQNYPLSQVQFIIRKWEWQVSVTAVLNFPLEVWYRTLHRPLAVKNARQQFWTFSVLLHFGSLIKKVCTEWGFCWADKLFV